MPQERYGVRFNMTEWSYNSGKTYCDPFNEVELDVRFTDGKGGAWVVPAYWAGVNEWRVRFAPPFAGEYHFISICSDEFNQDLHGQTGVLKVDEYSGENPLFLHGPLEVSGDKRHLQHADGTPFFWLGDTWWMSLCKRLEWPYEFKLLTDDRKTKGFTVIQLVAGLYPDMPAFDERGANEAGFPWEKDFSSINPSYFDSADLKIGWLVREGIVPCIVGCWAYFLVWMGLDRMKKHWRYLVARYGAYPVVWCLAGEGAMPYYLSKDKEGDRAAQIKGWTEIARYVKSIDPYNRPVTIHPTDASRTQVEDPDVLDFEMLQTGHGGHGSIPNTVTQMQRAVAGSPVMPVLNGEVCYEGILESSREEIQRFMFWACMLTGAAGHTYGANGIWQLNGRDIPYGPSPHGSSWGDTPWEEAYKLPGSAQVAIGKQILERFDWWKFQPHQEWVEPHADKTDFTRPFAAGIPGEVKIIYLPKPLAWAGPFYVKDLESDMQYKASFFDPKTGREYPIGAVEGPQWQIPNPVVMQDWVLVLERV